MELLIDKNQINNQSIYIYVKQSPFEALLYYECNDSKTGKHYSVEFISNLDYKSIGLDFISSLKSCQFFLTSNLEQLCERLTIDVWLLNSLLKPLKYHSQTFLNTKREVLFLMNYFYDFPLPTEPSNNGNKFPNIKTFFI